MKFHPDKDLDSLLNLLDDEEDAVAVYAMGELLDREARLGPEETTTPEESATPDTDKTPEEEEHVCKEVSGWKAFWNSIMNFFRRLFGQPELCKCGETIKKK